MHINLHSNGLKSINIASSNFSSLIKLNLFNNKLNNLNFGYNNTSLRELWIHNNAELQEVKNWPPYLDEIRADRQVVVKADFLTLVNLKRIYVYNGHLDKKELKNIKEVA